MVYDLYIFVRVLKIQTDAFDILIIVSYKVVDYFFESL